MTGVRKDIWDSTVRVTQIIGKRHKVWFGQEGHESVLTFCNECGSEFTVGFPPRCSGCGEPQDVAHADERACVDER